MPEWHVAQLRLFEAAVADRHYPCNFATDALVNRDLWTGYAASIDPRLQSTELAAAARDFIDGSAERMQKRPCLTFFLPPEGGVFNDLEASRERFWQLLQSIHELDTRPWPADVPADPENPDFMFCFHGDKMFVFASTPAYRFRRSRNLCDGFAMVFVLERSFKGINRGTPEGDRAHRLIRARCGRWDDVPAHPEFASDKGGLGWKSYFVPDDDSPVLGRCPLRIRPAGRDPRC